MFGKVDSINRLRCSNHRVAIMFGRVDSINRLNRKGGSKKGVIAMKKPCLKDT